MSANGKSRQKKKNSSCSSAVFNVLKNTSMESIGCVRLVSDVPGGQNKNSAFIYMAEHWLVQYLPCDRVFGVVEKNLRRTERIYRPEDHYPSFQENGKLFDVSKIWPVLLLQSKIGSLLQKTAACKVSMGVPVNPAKKFDIRKLLQEHAAGGGGGGGGGE